LIEAAKQGATKAMAASVSGLASKQALVNAAKHGAQRRLSDSTIHNLSVDGVAGGGDAAIGAATGAESRQPLMDAAKQGVTKAPVPDATMSDLASKQALVNAAKHGAQRRLSEASAGTDRPPTAEQKAALLAGAKAKAAASASAVFAASAVVAPSVVNDDSAGKPAAMGGHGALPSLAAIPP